ncbi:sulfurtransferase TusA [Marinomonas sp. A79]|uniref:Sulfurtransferase TusA n=1 Tax=Marinomonas vulgaris TaxID=2823372 RepID=A0ABS5H9Y1_9GAMM|nr:sulfurtransferase TusA [Marinomonas vulgaris]MBR7888425.1 sulfurtransferase TusA [Marinomonas vulgaris]
MNHKAILDATGLLCPEPVMLLHVEMRKLAGKDVLKVIATDPSTTRDIPKFCQFLGHTLLEQKQEESTYYYWIEKKSK